MITYDQPKNTRDFYHVISEIYDDMTHFQQRLNTEMRTLSKWLEKYKIRSVLDAACGSGLHTISLARLGVPCVGIDISQEMIKIAKKNAAALQVQAQFLQSDLREMSNQVKQNFDAILFLGNSLPHLTPQTELNRIMLEFRKILNPQGMLIIQLLNYDKILDAQERIISITRRQQNTYIRFYDFYDSYLQFNILHINWRNEEIQHRLISTRLYPYLKSEVESILQDNGFTILDIYGSMDFKPFDITHSKNLIIIGLKDNN
jgi:glycine/sarcosine N-methyltransferase